MQTVTVIPVQTIPVVTAGIDGTFTFRPLQGNFNKDTDLIGKMDPYCKIKLGHHKAKTEVAKHQGKHPFWNDAIVLERKHHEEFAKLTVKDRDRLSRDDRLGEAKIPLNEIAAKGIVEQWFNVHKGNKITGEVLMRVEFHPKHAL